MELRRYLSILRRGWWLAVPVFLATVALSSLMVLRQETVYESTSTYVVRPNSVEVTDSLRAFDTLIRGVEINATYATIARSEIVEARALERIGSPPSAGAAIAAEVITGTNLLKISARGDRSDVEPLVAAVGEETIAYIGGLQESYRLEPLDAASPPRAVGPNRPRGIAAGIVLGALLATVSAIVLELLRPRPPRRRLRAASAAEPARAGAA